MEEVQKHIRCKTGDVARYVLTPGSVERVEKIADHFDNKELVTRHREYLIYNGQYKGIDVTVCSTGIGGPSTSIALEELIKVGADTFIRVGSCGARQPNIEIGDVIVVDSAFRGEGTSKEYIDSAYPAAADHFVTAALIEAVRDKGRTLHIGTSYTRDAYYKQNPALNDLLTEYNVKCSEQECSTIYTLARIHGVRSGGIVGTDSNILLPEQPTLAEKEELFAKAEQESIEIALEAIYKLAQQDKSSSN